MDPQADIKTVAATEQVEQARLERQNRRAKLVQRSRLYGTLYLLAAPTVLSLLVFSYYPNIDAIIMSTFRWEPPTVQEFIGLENFKEAFSDPLFWSSFHLVGIILVANLFKMWPGIFAAIALHRLTSNRLRYIFQVCFVVPMIIPQMVFLLIWKSFYDPDFGILNRLLNATGGMRLLHWLDTAMPMLAARLDPVIQGFFGPVFGGVAGWIYLGALVIAFGGRRHMDAARWVDYAVILTGSVLLPVARAMGALESMAGVMTLIAVVIFWMINLARRLGSSWIAWPFLLLAGVGVFANALWRLPVAMGAALLVVEVVRARASFVYGRPILNGIGLSVIVTGALLVLLGHVWTTPTQQFGLGNPAWLGNQDLVIPAILFWGFPWVGTVGVLIYLSGLQNIPQDVYEAARIDGIGPIGMIFHIELPLIMTQVRINLIFMTIATLTGYEMFLILLGPDGGPGNKGMVPGLYMFSSAFAEGRFGYACALGMVLFVIILCLTIVYQKYVKVDK